MSLYFLKPTQSLKPEQVAEIQGEYGPLTISERLVQKIWVRGDFRQSGLKTLEGRQLELLNLGNWNQLDGPDFKNVSLLIDGKPVHGDAELHFYDSDWEAHGHDKDSAFANVVLHILVFPPKKRTRAARCNVKHSLLFIDLLPQGLESYAEEEMLEVLATGDELALEEHLLSLDLEGRVSRLMKAARKRWKGKVEFARKRLELLGWEEACHQTAMEILGYRYNRPAMLFVAGDYTLGALRSGSYTAEEIFEAGRGRWRLRGSRPANQPKQRLVQYLEWVAERPQWPEDLTGWGTGILKHLQTSAGNPSRKGLNLKMWKQKCAEQVIASKVGGTRIENLVCDGFLPLLAAHSNEDFFLPWYHWYPGDAPSALKQLYSRLSEGRSALGPGSNGSYQGLIGCLLEKP